MLQRPPDRTEERTRRCWTGFIVAFFAAQVVLWACALSLVSGDVSHAVVADYDARALGWDAQQAGRARSAALGWGVQIHVEPGTPHDEPMVRLVLRDRDANAVAADDVELTVFHHAAAADRRSVDLVASGPGVYRGPAALSRAGKWRFEVRARRGDDVFTHIESRILSPRRVP